MCCIPQYLHEILHRNDYDFIAIEIFGNKFYKKYKGIQGSIFKVNETYICREVINNYSKKYNFPHLYQINLNKYYKD